MNVVFYEVGKYPVVVEVENKLEDFQKLVGGYIEIVRIGAPFVLVVNEEGFNLNLKRNRGHFVGNMFVCKEVETEEGTEMEGLTQEEVKKAVMVVDKTLPHIMSLKPVSLKQLNIVL